MRIRRYWAIGTAATAALCLAGGAAFAAVSATPLADTNGTAGYGALAPGVQYFNNVQSTITPDQYATTVKLGVLGVQLSTVPVAGVCNAAQAGEVANLNSTFAVQYGLGAVGSVTNPCPVGGAIALVDRHTFTGLGAVANTDDVWVSINVGNNCKIRHGDKRHHDVSWGYSKCRGHRYGVNTLTFYAQDLTTNSPVIVATVPCNTNKFTNAAAGTNEDAAALTNGPVVHRLVTDNALSPVDYFDATDQILVRFSYATATLNGGTSKSFDLLNSSLAYGDATAAANSAANPAQVSTQNSLSNVDHGPSGPASFGASAAGSDFTGWSANAGL